MIPTQFKEIWFYDFEFKPGPNMTVIPVCMVAKEYYTQRIEKLWLYKQKETPAPFNLNKESLFIGYSMYNAELACHVALHWPLPRTICDLYVEYRILVNGREIEQRGLSLLQATDTYGISNIGVVKKEQMRDLILQSEEFTEKDQQDIIDYCASDVLITELLFEKMAPHINLLQAVYRGKYIIACCAMVQNGIPIDGEIFNLLSAHWTDIKLKLIEKVNEKYHVFEGTRFKEQYFERFLAERGIQWPRTPHGHIALDKDTFKDFSRAFPELQPIYQTRNLLSKVKMVGINITEDGRNRAALWPFKAKTGRNLPSSSEFIFGNDSWMRALIKPESGKAICYLDFKQQEVAIGAKLSNDKNLMDVYLNEDPYIRFGQLCHIIPEGATKASHPNERARFKECLLGTNYGMGVHALSSRAGISERQARDLLNYHKQHFASFWSWLETMIDNGVIKGEMHTCFGFKLHTQFQQGLTLRNFMLQAHGAEILRLAIIMLLDAGIKVLCPVHDAVLIEDDSSTIDETVKKAQQIMEQASEVVLDGFPVKVEYTIFKHPDRFMDKRGVETWNNIMEIVKDLDSYHRDFSFTGKVLV